MVSQKTIVAAAEQARARRLSLARRDETRPSGSLRRGTRRRGTRRLRRPRKKPVRLGRLRGFGELSPGLGDDGVHGLGDERLRVLLELGEKTRVEKVGVDESLVGVDVRRRGFRRRRPRAARLAEPPRAEPRGPPPTPLHDVPLEPTHGLRLDPRAERQDGEENQRVFLVLRRSFYFDFVARSVRVVSLRVAPAKRARQRRREAPPRDSFGRDDALHRASDARSRQAARGSARDLDRRAPQTGGARLGGTVNARFARLGKSTRGFFSGRVLREDPAMRVQRGDRL